MYRLGSSTMHTMHILTDSIPVVQDVSPSSKTRGTYFRSRNHRDGLFRTPGPRSMPGLSRRAVMYFLVEPSKVWALLNALRVSVTEGTV